MRHFLNGSLFALALMFGSTVSSAQSRGTLSGKVTDAASGEPIAGVKVFIVETFEEVITDDQGGFQIMLDPGRYSILIDQEGFESAAQKVEIKAGATVVLEIGLQPQ